MKKQTTRLMLAAFLILCGVMASCKKETTDPENGTVKLQCEKPNYLVEGDTVALISPSYYTPMENIERTAEVLRGWGLTPILGPNVDKIYQGKYAGTVEERVSDLRWALNRPGIKAIICNRGGYGTIQLINKLSYNDFKANPKWLVGFSDITTLHGLESRAGVMSIHGTMSSFLAAGGTDATSILMRDLLKGQVPRYELPAHPQNIMGQAQGVLVGGNICTFAPNLGTQADATKAEDIILFIEEVGESMHNIDRQFHILVMNGVLDRCKGVILGSFVSCGSEFEYESIEVMLRSYLTAYNIPVMCGFPAGHDDINLPLVMGAPVTMDVRADGATLQFDIEGQQTEVRTADISATETPLEYRLKRSGKME